MAAPDEIELLRSEIIALRQLLELQEELVAQQATRLEQAVAESERRAAQLSVSEQALQHQADALAAQNRALTEREREKSELIDRLRLAIDEIATPVLEVGQDMLVLPIVGVVDEQRAEQIIERALHQIAAKRSRITIIDVTGVEEIDAVTAARLVKLFRAVRLLGARCILSGVRPAMAAALARLEVNLDGADTARDLRHAIAYGAGTLAQ
jgi:anti-anti-sigma regulatory factor